MNLNTDLIHTVAGVPNTVNLEHELTTQQPLQPQPPQPEMDPQLVQYEQQDHGDRLEFQQSSATSATQLPPASTISTTHATATPSTVPPEIIQLIVNYLDNRDLVKVITLNWTWAHWAAPRLWHQIDYTVQSSRIFFLITKSVAPPSPDKALSTVVFTSPPLATDPLLSTLSSSSSSEPPLPGTFPTAANSSLAETGFTSTSSSNVSEVLEDRPPQPKRRRSYPWPTLLPYHTMVHTLNISLSTADMVQDLLELIPCCSELRSFALHSAIPTEDLLIRGVVASACNDALDPLNPSRNAMTVSSSLHRNSATSTSSASLASMAQGGAHASHSHSHSLSLDPYNSSTNPRAGLQEADDETIMTSSISQSGMLLKLLSQSCPKLEKIWFSGFHPVSVLGAPTDLRPRPVQEHRRSAQLNESLAVQPPVTAYAPFQSPSIGSSTSLNMTTVDASLPPIPPVPGINSAVALPASTSPATVAAAISQQQAQSKIHSVQFVNCTLPPQYLLTMIQHSLPNLTELALTQCWQGNPLTETFLTSVAKVCPNLKKITLHATQNHRDSVTSENLLKMLQGLEGKPKDKDEGYRYYRSTSVTPQGTGVGSGGVTLADFPLGTFRKTSYTTAPSISSTAATVGSSSLASHSSSSSSTPSSFVPIPTLSSSSSSIAESSVSPLPSPSSVSSSYLANGGSNFTNQGPTSNGFLSAQPPYHQQQQQSHQSTYFQDTNSSSAPGSDLESISVWFTHSTLDQAIAAELASRTRHPRLRRVEFGSEDAFDVGEDLIRQLGQQREELDVTWVSFGDTGDDRDD
ncbi:hypothetical protein EC991_009911 [Linnemannia zychae]|nr:hypothetical protein EC991_009911 [Linnemannia zychae]